MKQISILSAAIICFTLSLTAQQLTFSFTTQKLPMSQGYEYTPSHVMAVWIEEANGRFVNTIAQYGFIRQNYLEKWQSNTGGFTEDAITGATLSTHTNRTFNWNLQSYRGTVVANGDYTVCIEYTARDGAGPIYKYPITITGDNFVLTPDDETFLTHISIEYTGGSTAVTAEATSHNFLQVSPNPLTTDSKINLHQTYGSQVTLQLVSVSGQILRKKVVITKPGNNSYNIAAIFETIPTGIFFVVAKTPSVSFTTKVINK